MSETLTSDASLTIPEVARRTGASIWTVRRWVRAGRLRAYRVGPCGQWRVRLDELQRVTGQGRERVN